MTATSLMCTCYLYNLSTLGAFIVPNRSLRPPVTCEPINGAEAVFLKAVTIFTHNLKRNLIGCWIQRKQIKLYKPRNIPRYKHCDVVTLEIGHAAFEMLFLDRAFRLHFFPLYCNNYAFIRLGSNIKECVLLYVNVIGFLMLWGSPISSQRMVVFVFAVSQYKRTH